MHKALYLKNVLFTVQ